MTQPEDAPDLPAGTYVSLNGEVRYSGGRAGEFVALLARQDGEWKLLEIDVSVPPG